MNVILAALLLFGAVDVKTAQKGDLYDDSVVVTNVNEAAFVKWGTTSGKTLQIDGGYVSSTVSTGGVNLVGSVLNVKGSAQYPARVSYNAKNVSNQGAYEIFESGTGIYFPKNADMAAASVYGLQSGYESLDERLTRKFNGIFSLDTDNNGDKTAFRIGSRAVGTYVGPYSSIFGYLNEASAQGALAGGYESAAGGVYDFVWGRSARASAGYATAFGFRPNATNETAFVWQGSALYGETPYGSHGKGTFNVNPVNGYSGFYIGSQSLAGKFGEYLKLSGNQSTPITGEVYFKNGSSTNAYDALIFGHPSYGLAVFSAVTVGTRGTGKVADYSLVNGYACLATNDYAHAEGDSTDAVGAYSHAEGDNTIASGRASHAEGMGSVASGSRAHAEGFHTTSSGRSTHSEGYYTTASGHYSHSEGCYSWSSNLYSFAWNGTASGYSQNNLYGTHGDGTFNLNPVGGLSGLWIGETNLATHVAKAITNNVASWAMAGQPQPSGGGGGGGITNRIESVDKLNAIYADGSWVTRTNATSGVAVTNTICTVSNVVTTVNEVKRKFYDAPLQVEWRFEAVNGEFMMIATTNVNTEVIQ